MRQALLGMFAAVPLLSGCAHDAYGRSSIDSRTQIGVLAGGALGALAGHAVGTNAVAGALVGAVAGGAIGAAVKGPVRHGRQYYKDSRGYCYYVDPSGQPVYDPAVSC